jgi:hypothetical protein
LHAHTAGGRKGYTLHAQLPILMVVERDTPCTFMKGEGGGGKEYILHVHTAGGGKGYIQHVLTAAVVKGVPPAR